MTQQLRRQLLYLALAIYILLSGCFLVFGIAGRILDLKQESTQVVMPIQVDADLSTISQIDPSARDSGLAVGDRIVTLNGLPYEGNSSWRALQQTLRPRDRLTVVVRGPDGDMRQAMLPLAKPPRGWSIRLSWATVLLLLVLPPTISLLVGYWVVLARTRDPHAWMLLLLLSYPEIFYLSPGHWTGHLLGFMSAWHGALDVVDFPVLLLFGIYFPERWRLDRKAPWLKWVVMALSALALGRVEWAEYHENFAPLPTVVAGYWNPLDAMLRANVLACILLYWAALFDKLRTASTADNRRRMRVLLAGSLPGLGGPLLLVVLLPAMGVSRAAYSGLEIAGAILFLLYPFTLAYVVVVERAMDVRILLRMGTKYALARASVQAIRIAVVAFLLFRFVLPMLQKREHHPSELFVLAGVIALIVRVFISRDSLSGRLAQWIDHRFFREAYNAEQVLSELSEQVRGFTDPEPLVEILSRRIGEVLHVPRVSVLLDTGGGAFELQGASGLQEGSVHASGDGAMGLLANSYTIRNLKRTNRPVTLYRENPDGWFLLADEEERHVLDELHAELLLPVSGRDRLMGVVTLSAKLSQEPYTPSDLRLLQSVATQAGFALEISRLGRSLAEEAAQRERIDREIEIAREVQDRLFPQGIPQVQGVTLAGACRPAQGVGGDYYDVIELGDGRVGLAVGDVSGKGISAALLMASLRASLHVMTMDGAGDLERMMEKVNRLVYEASASNRYATFFFGAFDPRTRVVQFVNAGHNPPMVLRGNGEVLRLDVGGPVVGLLPDARYEVGYVALEAGDLLLAYTDGISEAMTAEEEEWGEDRMAQAACAKPGLDAEEVLRCVFAEADAFSRGAPQHDDMTLLVLKMNEAPVRKPDEEQERLLAGSEAMA